MYRALSRSAADWGLEICRPAPDFGVVFDEVLGAGATSRVFLATYRQKPAANADSDEDEHVVCKVFRYPQVYQREKEMLEYLCGKVNTCVKVGESDTHMQLLLAPHAFPLRATDLKSRALATQLLQAVNELHYADVIHCDLRPENVLICEESRKLKVLLIDFGSAVHSKAGEFCGMYTGTVRYASPEILRQLSTSGHDNVRISKTDDLQSLIRVFFMWINPGAIPLLNQIRNDEYENVQKFWETHLSSPPWNVFSRDGDQHTDHMKKLLGLIKTIFADFRQ